MANAQNLGDVLRRERRRPVPPGAIPTSSEVAGPVNDAAAVCSAASVQSVSPPPVHTGRRKFAEAHVLHPSGYPTGAGMVGLGKQLRKNPPA